MWARWEEVTFRSLKPSDVEFSGPTFSVGGIAFLDESNLVVES